MPDHRRHRGPHPEDAALFGREQHARLREGVHDLSWLLSRGYASPSSIKIVGDRYALAERQRVAVMRCACSDQAFHARLQRRVSPDRLLQSPLVIDGYNVLTTVEAAMAGGVILGARDGCCRDLASVHGTWRKVAETQPALALVGTFLRSIGAGAVTWLLDRPVSNSGRLREIMLAVALENGWNWTIELVADPDAILGESPDVVATADGAVLDRPEVRWLNLARLVIQTSVPGAPIVELGDPSGCA